MCAVDTTFKNKKPSVIGATAIQFSLFSAAEQILRRIKQARAKPSKTLVVLAEVKASRIKITKTR